MSCDASRCRTAELLAWILGTGLLLVADLPARADTADPAAVEGGRGLASPPVVGGGAGAGGRVTEGAEGLAVPPVVVPEGAGQAWQGPRVELGYARYRMSDGNGGGAVNGLSFGGYLPTGAARLGMYGELALRDYSLGPTSDILVRGAVLAGYQQLRGLGPVVPYLVALGTGGVLFGQRYHTPESHTLWGAGIELGADVNLVRSLWAGASFSWIRITMRGLHWDLFMLRVRAGL